MKVFILVLFISVVSFSKTIAQNRNLSFLVGRWEAVDVNNGESGFEVVDTSKIVLFYGKDKKPIVSFQADFSKSPAWFDFTIKDTSGSIKLQSLLQIINDDLIQWQLFEGARGDKFIAGQGEILFLRRKQ